MEPQKLRAIFRLWLAAVVISSLTWWMYFAPWSFDSAVWKSKPAQRHRMVDDLVSQKTLIGKSREEVIAILGDQEMPGYDQGANESRLIYRVGGTGNIKGTWLEVRFTDSKCQNVGTYYNY